MSAYDVMRSKLACKNEALWEAQQRLFSDIAKSKKYQPLERKTPRLSKYLSTFCILLILCLLLELVVLMIEWAMFNVIFIGIGVFLMYKAQKLLFGIRQKWIRSYKMKPFKKLVSKHNVIYFKELDLAVKVEYELRKAHWITFTLEDNLKMYEDEILKT